MRGPDPEWYSLAEAVNAGPKHMKWSTSKTQLGKYNIHASETAWVGTEFDAVLDNNGSLDHLYKQINDLVLNHPAATEDPAAELR